MDIKALQEKLEKLFGEMKSLDGAISKSADEEGKATARSAFEAKRAELEVVQGELDAALLKAEKEAAIQKSLNRASDNLKAQVPAGAKLATVEVQAKDQMRISVIKRSASIATLRAVPRCSPVKRWS